MADQLTEKQDKFCLEYVKDLNASQAAIRAGYAKGSARVQASKMLTKNNIQSRIRQLMSKRKKRLELSGDMVVQRLANIAFGHMGMVCVWTDKGLDLKSSEELTDAEMAMIQDIEVSPISDGDGGLLGYKKKVRLKDSLKALEMLSKHLGILDGQGAERKNTGVIKEKLLKAVKSISGE